MTATDYLSKLLFAFEMVEPNYDRNPNLESFVLAHLGEIEKAETHYVKKPGLSSYDPWHEEREFVNSKAILHSALRLKEAK